MLVIVAGHSPPGNACAYFVAFTVAFETFPFDRRDSHRTLHSFYLLFCSLAIVDVNS
jgi:hypothetical protein